MNATRVSITAANVEEEVWGERGMESRQSLNRNKVENVHNKPTDPIYILNPSQNLRSPDRETVGEGQHEMCATWTNDLSEF